MESEDGLAFVKNLAHFVRTHERALANALQLQHQRVKNGGAQAAPGVASNTSASSSLASSSISLSFSRPYLSFTARNVKAARLSLTPHHLYYLLSKFEDLGVNVGPMKVRLEDIHSNAAPSEYMSFLGNAPKSRGKQSDADSLKSVSSVRSVMSSVSSLWSNFSLTNSAAKTEKQMAHHREDIKYLYSCFTKIPALRLCPNHHARLISGYEMQPFDTAVPLFAFKNVSALEICDIDFRQFHGWDKLAENLRSLTVKRAHLDDPLDLLVNIVLDDMVGRRVRSSKTQAPTTPSTPGISAWPSNSPKPRHIGLARSFSTQEPMFGERRRPSIGSPKSAQMTRGGSSDGATTPSTPNKGRSNSPIRPPSSKRGSLQKPRRRGAPLRRSSGSSGSSTHEGTSRHSTPDLLAIGWAPAVQWRCLRHLSLAENGITTLNAQSLAPVADTLHSLDLSGNLLSEIPDLTNLTHLRALNLSNCMIDSLSSLSRTPLPAVTVLNLRSNRLLQLNGIERMLALERIDVRDNKLHDPAELARLTGLPNIVDLYVAKNPFTKAHPNYRINIFNLFRRVPGYTEDVKIDSCRPQSNETKYLVDRVPEPAIGPVIKPEAEDEDTVTELEGSETATEGGAAEMASASPVPQEHPSEKPSYRRTTSETVSQSARRRKKAPRRRVVELSEVEPQSNSTIEPTLLHASELPPLTPAASSEPTTPDSAPYHTAPTTQAQTRPPAQRPTLDTAFTSPTPSPRIRDPSDDDEDSPLRSPQDLGSNTDLYRQKIEALKNELGTDWLRTLNEDRFADQRSRNRSFSPTSRTSTIRPQNRGVSAGGRTLG